MCIACRRKGEQESFWRVAAGADGKIGLWSGAGRSAYICRSEECVAAAMGKGRLDRALRRRVDEAERAGLREELKW